MPGGLFPVGWTTNASPWCSSTDLCLRLHFSPFPGHIFQKSSEGFLSSATEGGKKKKVFFMPHVVSLSLFSVCLASFYGRIACTISRLPISVAQPQDFSWKHSPKITYLYQNMCSSTEVLLKDNEYDCLIGFFFKKNTFLFKIEALHTGGQYALKEQIRCFTVL